MKALSDTGALKPFRSISGELLVIILIGKKKVTR